MKQLRYWVPVLGILALAALFLKMPETPGIFECKTCGKNSPYLPMIGGGYFAILIAISMLFPTFPGPLLARGGLIWASLLALTLTYIDFPTWCVVCIIGHTCNILIWTVWCFVPPTSRIAAPFMGRLFLTLLAPLCVVTLFSCLNLTFMIYPLQAKHTITAMGLQPGDAVPKFILQSEKSGTFTDADIAATAGTFINFVSLHCPYCTEQLAILSDVAAQLAGNTYQFINISASLPLNLDQQPQAIKWFADKEGKLRELFKVSGYPTLFLVGANGKVQQVIPGVPEGLRTSLLTYRTDLK